MYIQNHSLYQTLFNKRAFAFGFRIILILMYTSRLVVSVETN